MKKNAKIYIAGHRGLVGSALMRCLQKNGYSNLLTRTHAELDLTDQAGVHQFFEREKPNYVFLAAAKVGGIHANSTYPAEFIYQNLQMQNNIIHSSYLSGVKKLLFLGSSCIYPRLCPQPMKEEYLLTGPLEPTNEPYAIAKIAGIKMCQAYNKQYRTNFISVMPTNLYGPNDNWHPENSHLLPAMIQRFHSAKINHAKEVVVWGTGTPTRELFHSDDLAEACLFLMSHYNSSEIINIGTGQDLSIADIATLVKKVVGFNGEMVFDTSKPDGMPKKVLEISRLTQLGWRAKIGLEEGIKQVYGDYLHG